MQYARGLPQPMTLGPSRVSRRMVTSATFVEVWIDKEGTGYRDTTALSQTFALGITAEPYFAVRLPSEVVVLVNYATKRPKGKIFPENSYKLKTFELAAFLRFSVFSHGF
jgi:hypothetical protein